MLPTRKRLSISLFLLPYRPCLLCLWALSLAVFLWGFGYKISLYQAGPVQHARTSVAKLWVEHRSASAVMAATQTIHPHRIPASQLFLTPLRRTSFLPHLSSADTCSKVVRLAAFKTRAPLRAPPSVNFGLA